MNKLFKSPPTWLLLTAYILTLISIGCSMTALALGLTGIFAYASYSLAAITLAYSVYTLIRFMPKIKLAVKSALKKSKLASRYIKDYGFRSFIGTAVSFSVNLLLSIFTGIWGIASSSVWYCSLSIYYILLTLIYGCLMLNRKKEKNHIKIYRICGVLLMILNSALSVSIAQMIFFGEGFEYGELMIYVYATYAFYKITIAIVRFCKLKRHCSPLAHATACINLTGGMVSVLALQTALLSTFGAGINVSLFNTLTGSAVSLTSISLSIFMIFKKFGEKNESQQI